MHRDNTQNSLTNFVPKQSITMASGSKHVVLTGNTGFKIANFRAGLIRSLLADGHRLTVIVPVDDYFDKLIAMGCAVVPLTVDRNGTNPLAEARLLITIFLKIRKAQPDVVFSYTIKNNIYAGLTCRALRIPYAPNVTGLGPAFNGRGMLNWTVRRLYRLAFRSALLVFFQNIDDRATFVDADLIKPELAKLLPGSGVDLMQFSEQPGPHADDGITFLFVARLLWDKGLGVLIEAAREVRKVHPDTRFQILGALDPDSKSAITTEQLREWVEEGIIDYLGSTDDVRPMLASAHCVVLPSYYREGTPRTLIEACATGRPVITTDMPGCRDVVEPGKTGFLCAPRDVQSLSQALLNFISLDSKSRSEMGKAARELAERRYDEANVISAYRGLMNVTRAD